MEDKSKRKSKEETKSSGTANRSRTIERRKERQREQRRQRQIALAVGITVVAVLIVGLIIISTLPADAPIPETALTNYEGLEVSRSPEGYPRIGNPNAPVQVVEYSSFDCPACKRFHDTDLSGVIERVRNGDILFTYVPIWGTGGITNGEGAAKAAVCAAEQGGFWPFHDALFDWQGRYANQAFTQARMGTGISNLGMDRGLFDACIRSNTSNAAVVQRAKDEAQSIPDFTGTPFIQVNGVTVTADLASINQAIDQALALAGTTPTIAETTPEVTVEATSEATSEATTEATTTAEATAEATP